MSDIVGPRYTFKRWRVALPEWVYRERDHAWICVHQDREMAAFESGQLPPYKLSYGPAFTQVKWFEAEQELFDWVREEADTIAQMFRDIQLPIRDRQRR